MKLAGNMKVGYEGFALKFLILEAQQVFFVYGSAVVIPGKPRTFFYKTLLEPVNHPHTDLAHFIGNLFSIRIFITIKKHIRITIHLGIAFSFTRT